LRNAEEQFVKLSKNRAAPQPTQRVPRATKNDDLHNGTTGTTTSRVGHGQVERAFGVLALEMGDRDGGHFFQDGA
jgi:phage tail sheath gpL-like